jgi:hypothetical protein
MVRTLLHPAILLLGAVLVAPLLPGGQLEGQLAPRLGVDGEVGAVASVRPVGSRVGQHVMPLLALGFALRVSPALEIGGEGLLGLRRVRVSADDSPDRAELGMGYGGVSIRYGPGSGNGVSGLHGAVLLGAGTARVHSTLINAELDADNFFVVEPSLEYRMGIGRGLAAAAGVGYRFTPGAAALPRVPHDATAGPTLSFVLHLVRNP